MIGHKQPLDPGGFMKRKLLWAALAPVMALSQTGTALAADDTGDSEAVFVTPLSLVNTSDLEFGTLLAGPTAGTVVINPNNDARSVTGGVTAAGSGGADCRSAPIKPQAFMKAISRSPSPIFRFGLTVPASHPNQIS
jgi:hypothetical protein